ncbi:phosphate transporter (Pho88) [Linderina pennispora]|nr:phosphate transporter (Pho88) [Linderina pennispora]
MTFVIKQKITQKNDTTALEYDDTAAGSSGQRIETTNVKYDLQEVAKLQKSSLFTVVIVLFMHFKFGYIQPLILQSILPLFNFVKSPLFQVHVLGKPATDSLARPWVPESPFGGAPAATNASTSSAAPAETEQPAAETRKDK